MQVFPPLVVAMYWSITSLSSPSPAIHYVDSKALESSEISYDEALLYFVGRWIETQGHSLSS